MFYEAKIFDREGKLTKRITGSQLSERHWRLFREKMEPSVNKPKRKVVDDQKAKKGFNFNIDILSFEGS
tara:strand:- start:217 stop:423 length:207 start_codon:yes stop_codon:yes gene_type:complete